MKEEFAFLVLEVVSEIPIGKVASYSQIAKLCGRPQNARLVGKILSNADYFGSFPCHRVVHNTGELVKGWTQQKDLLQEENVIVLNNKVNMKQYKWSK